MKTAALLSSAVLLALHVQAQEIAFAPAAPTLECETVTGRRCQFPFTFKGKEYTQCTNDGTTNGKPWCAYELRRNGEVIPGKWEDCDTSVCAADEVCKTESGPDQGNSCKFPFTHNGVTHFSCARWTWQGTNHGKYWCSTKVDRNGNHINGRGHYGFCGFCDQPECGCTNCQFQGKNKPTFDVRGSPALGAASSGDQPN